MYKYYPLLSSSRKSFFFVEISGCLMFSPTITVTVCLHSWKTHSLNSLPEYSRLEEKDSERDSVVTVVTAITIKALQSNTSILFRLLPQNSNSKTELYTTRTSTYYTYYILFCLRLSAKLSNGYTYIHQLYSIAKGGDPDRELTDQLQPSGY